MLDKLLTACIWIWTSLFLLANLLFVVMAIYKNGIMQGLSIVQDTYNPLTNPLNAIVEVATFSPVLLFTTLRDRLRKKMAAGKS